MIKKNQPFPAQNLLDPKLHTRMLRDAVPAIHAINFTFLEVAVGHATASLPLNQNSSNQHGTHQAMLLAMAGDYTGGLALATLIKDEPILGVHEISAEKGMSLWLLKNEMAFMAPSTEDVIVSATIPKEKNVELTKRYHRGQTILFDVELAFRTIDGKMVAKGLFKYYLKKKSLLHISKPGRRIDAMFEHILKTSAKLIAAIRGLEGQRANALFNDPISLKVAGKQGEVISTRFLKTMPELQNMVSARTIDLDNYVSSNTNFDQVLFIGAGLDFRMLRNANDYKNKAIFEMDLAEMIEERGRLEIELNTKNEHLNRTATACNFLTESILEKLTATSFNPLLSTLLVYEGCSMYFNKEDNYRILIELGIILKQNTNSRLWMDVVAQSILDNPEKDKNASNFLKKMAVLGEPFICGFEENDDAYKKAEIEVVQSKNTTDYFNDANSIYGMYDFIVLKSS